MKKVYQWVNREKARYYTITMQKDGTNDIVLNYDWGSCNTNRGGKKDIYVSTEEEAEIYIRKMIKRRKSRGYDLIAP
jgi:DNA polymerase-3 subunit epsilon